VIDFYFLFVFFFPTSSSLLSFSENVSLFSETGAFKDSALTFSTIGKEFLRPFSLLIILFSPPFSPTEAETTSCYFVCPSTKTPLSELPYRQLAPPFFADFFPFLLDGLREPVVGDSRTV